ncbi:unnamed protein product [Lactuca virosa]|uniref:Uncharacterized protein n=1 Tax=Lactuca virosa TaxID=75947 RepID=A0AAU9NKV6_9ASTR|nr:unnamed protein product [Lactuca virosa]
MVHIVYRVREWSRSSTTVSPTSVLQGFDHTVDREEVLGKHVRVNKEGMVGYLLGSTPSSDSHHKPSSPSLDRENQQEIFEVTYKKAGSVSYLAFIDSVKQKQFIKPTVLKPGL